MAIAAEAMLNGKFKQTGVEVPLHREYYDVILPELERMGVHFEETHKKC
jgi:Ni,Fe-hydrogenase III large subunit